MSKDKKGIKRILLSDLSNETDFYIDTKNEKIEEIGYIRFFGIDENWIYIGTQTYDEQLDKPFGYILKVSYDGKEQVCLYKHSCYYNSYFYNCKNNFFYAISSSFNIIAVDLKNKKETEIFDFKTVMSYENDDVNRYDYDGYRYLYSIDSTADGKIVFMGFLDDEYDNGYMVVDNNNKVFRDKVKFKNDEWIEKDRKNAISKIPSKYRNDTFEAVICNNKIYFIRDIYKNDDYHRNLYFYNLDTKKVTLSREKTNFYYLETANGIFYGLAAYDFARWDFYELDDKGHHAVTLGKYYASDEECQMIWKVENFLFIKDADGYSRWCVGFYNPGTKKMYNT